MSHNPFEPDGLDGLGADTRTSRVLLVPALAFGGLFAVMVLWGAIVGEAPAKKRKGLRGLGRVEGGRRLKADDEATVRERVGRFAAGETVVVISSHESKSEGLKYKVVSDSGAEGWVPDWALS